MENNEKLSKLRKHIDLAYKILNGEYELNNGTDKKKTKYKRDKEIIAAFFNESELTEDKIIAQLTIIDAYYSTNMNRRYFGIEELANHIFKLSGKSNELVQKFEDFFNNPKEDSEVYQLFNNFYGIQKNGKKHGRAVSLISKYAYFLTGYKFPIYDSIVREVLPVISVNTIGEKLTIKENDIINFIKKIKKFSDEIKYDDFDKLDNFLWLTGKILKGNFYLILTGANQYEKILPEKEIIKDYIESNKKKNKNEESKKPFEELIKSNVKAKLKLQDNDFLEKEDDLRDFITYIYSEFDKN